MGWTASVDLVGPLLAEGAQVYGCPGAEGPPGLGDVVECVVGAVAFGDFGLEPALVVGYSIRRVRAANDDELSGEGPETLDLLHYPDGCVRVDRAQGRAVEAPVEGGLGDGVQVLGLAAG